MFDPGVVALIVAAFAAVGTVAQFWFGRKKTGAETDKTKAEAVKIYQEVAADVREEQEKREDQWAAKFCAQEKEIEALKGSRDLSNNEIAQLRREVNLTQVENGKLNEKIVALEAEAVNYRTAISTLLHENGALKEWAERLVKQLTGLGIIPDPFVKKPRTNE